jgi:predicted RNA-binding protein with PUA domain
VPAKVVVAQIAKVEEGGELTLDEVKERFRSRLAEEGGIKRLMDSLRKQTYVKVNDDALVMTQAEQAPPAATEP